MQESIKDEKYIILWHAGIELVMHFFSSVQKMLRMFKSSLSEDEQHHHSWFAGLLLTKAVQVVIVMTGGGGIDPFLLILKEPYHNRNISFGF